MYKSKFQEAASKPSLKKDQELVSSHHRDLEKFANKLFEIEGEMKGLIANIVTSKVAKFRRRELQKVTHSLEDQIHESEKIRKLLKRID